jgi:CBS domain-containing protein
MFTIYKNGTVGFRDTADNLYTLDKVDGLAPSRHKPDYGIIHNFAGKEKNKEEQKSSLDQKAINEYKKMANIEPNDNIYHVQEIMNTDIISIYENQTIQEAYEILKEKQISQIPIISLNGMILGMINKKIILNLILDDLTGAKRTLHHKLNSIDHSSVITTDPISDIRRVAKVMLDFKLDAIPVVNEADILVGIISKTDIIKAVSHMPHFRLWA